MNDLLAPGHLCCPDGYFTSDPPHYELAIEGHQLELSSKELLSWRTFRRKFMASIQRVPTLPDTDYEWARFVDSLLRQAVKVDAPLGGVHLRQEVDEVIQSMPVGQNIGHLDRGQAVLVNGRRAFKLAALITRLGKRKLRPTAERLAAILQDLGCTYARPRIGGRQVRVWIAPVMGSP